MSTITNDIAGSERLFRLFEQFGGRRIVLQSDDSKFNSNFLCQFLATAKERGYKAVYANLFDQRHRPDIVLLKALRDSSEWKEVDTTTTLLALNTELEQIIDADQPTLLILNEIQHLITSAELDNFTSWLRTALDTHGSSSQLFTVFVIVK